MSQLKALIFDVDGTLAETEAYHLQAFNCAFKEAGVPWIWGRDLYMSLLSVTGGKERLKHFAARYDTSFLETPDIEAKIADLHKLKTKHYSRLVESENSALRPGVERLIREAKREGLRLAIATTTTRSNVTSLLTENFGEDGLDLFEVISASDSAPTKKPAPDVYLYALNKLGLGPENCIAFEDSQNGLLSATAAGIKTIVTPSFFTECEETEAALAVVTDLDTPHVDVAMLREWAGCA